MVGRAQAGVERMLTQGGVGGSAVPRWLRSLPTLLSHPAVFLQGLTRKEEGKNGHVSGNWLSQSFTTRLSRLNKIRT